MYDLRVSTKAILGLSEPKNPPIALVIINTKTVEKFKGFPTFSDHVDFLKKIAESGASHMIYDFRIKDGEIRDIEGDEKTKQNFAQAAKQIQNFYIPTEELELKGESSKPSLNAPLENIPVYPTGKTGDYLLFAKDGVTRRILLNYQNHPLLQLKIASDLNPDLKNKDNIQGLFPLLGADQSYVHYFKKGSFPLYSFEDVVSGQVPVSTFKNKIVIVGTDTGLTAKEYVLTPYSRDINAMTTVELNAHMIQTLIENNAPIRWPRWTSLFLTILISTFTIHIVLTLKPSQGILLLFAAVFVLALVGLIFYVFFDIWLDLAHPFLAIFLCYYFFIPYRLIIENRKSWEYFQKNKLLQQVEELKTNFISMMSHDLKTPIARIQGMTEVISKDTNILSPTQREAVDTIKQSSDDLLKFINSILQYGRIESSGIVLHKQSKDINQILEDVIKKHEFLAKLKKIKIQTNLEPLFPVSVDPQLIHQVLSNLVENAIKYSTEDSRISIQSKEIDNHVVIEVMDYGLGIPEADLPNIFMKFFRTHQVKTSTIKGSGLGLYLAKYFIELHKGKIEVHSKINEGSKFTVSIPI